MGYLWHTKKLFSGPASSIWNVCLALCCGPGPVPVVSQRISARKGCLRGTSALAVCENPILFSNLSLYAGYWVLLDIFKSGMIWPACEAGELLSV